MKTLQLVARSGTTVLVEIDEGMPLLPQLALVINSKNELIILHDGSRLLPGDTFTSREMTDKDSIDLMESLI